MTLKKGADSQNYNVPKQPILLPCKFDLSHRIRKTYNLHVRKQSLRSAVQSNCTPDQCLCFRYTDNTIPLYQASASVTVYRICHFVLRPVRFPKVLVFSCEGSFKKFHSIIKEPVYRYKKIWAQGYKTFFMLSSAETTIYRAHKC